MKLRVFSWCFTRWYYWLAVGVSTFIQVGNIKQYSPVSGTEILILAGAVAFGFSLWFTLGRFIYVKGYNRGVTS